MSILRRTVLRMAVVAGLSSITLIRRSFFHRHFLSSFELCVPASDMRDRVISFRKELVNEYLTPTIDFPIFEMLSRANVLPVDNVDLTKLNGRGSISIKTIPATPNARLLLNDKGKLLNPQFIALINDQAIRLRVRIPKPLRITARYDANSLELDLQSPVVITLEDKIKQNGIDLPIFDQQVLKKVSMSDQALTYQFSENGTPTNTFTLKLDLTSQCAPIGNLFGFARAFARNLTRLGLTALLFGLMSISCNHGDRKDPCDHRQLNHSSLTPITTECARANHGVLSDQGRTYFRTDKNIANPTFCTFVRVDANVKSNDMIKVCSDVIVPEGWFESAPYKDSTSDRCSPEPGNLFNEKFAIRCYDIAITPADTALPVATKGSNYSQSLIATDNGGDRCKSVYSFAVDTSTSLPGGLKLQNNTISGVPTNSGNFTFKVIAKGDKNGCTRTQTYTLMVS